MSKFISNSISNEEQDIFQDYSFPPRRNSTTTIPNQNQFYSTSSLFKSNDTPPFFREQRSMSFSFGLEDMNNNNNNNNLYLDTIMQEEEEEEDSNRSKLINSSNIWHPLHQQKDWLNNQRRSSFMDNNLLNQRRLSTTIIDQQEDELNLISERMRRFSLAPTQTKPENHFNSFQSNLNQNQIFQRRHSLAVPTCHNIMNSINTDNILSSLAIRSNLKSLNSNETIMKIDDMGKGTRLDSDKLHQAIFYIIEFKGGRSDLYYSHQLLQPQDLVILEADRGQDIGKIIKVNIQRDQLEIYYNKLKNGIQEQPKYYGPNEIYIKSIFRLARPDEITLLMTKHQDEAKALMICQSKIKQKNLTMQVVDAEYQWDRRKLTFYFIAEKRVDFRELVRELFKLYKTRIWMCAVNSIVHLE